MMSKGAEGGHDSAKGGPAKPKVQFNPATMYRNFSTPKGLCLDLSNGIFFGPPGKPLPNRVVAEIDDTKMADLYSRMGYEIILKRNLTANEIRLAILEFRNDPRHNSLDSAIVIVMSHGRSRGIYGTDGEIIDLAELIDPLNDQNCPSLAGKPKVFTILTSEVEPVGPGEGGVVQQSDLTGPDMILTFCFERADLSMPPQMGILSTCPKHFYMFPGRNE